mgnify:FL=1
MKRGIDVSEHKGTINWQDVVNDGNEFAIIRLGWGNQHLDERFYDNFNGALNAGLKVGIYYYSEATDASEAAAEAEYALYIMQDAGITPDMLEMGFWFDEENDDWKSDRLTDPEEITDICTTFINTLEEAGYHCGLYANYDYLTNVIDMSRLLGVTVWCAQYNSQCDYDRASIWQYTDSARINGKMFDADIILE